MLWTIANALCSFQKKYWVREENYLEAPLFKNDFVLCERPRPCGGRTGPGEILRLRRETRNAFSTELLSLKIK
jgi:hypothetical protein